MSTRLHRCALALAGPCVLSACMGTYESRPVGRDSTRVGWPLFGAVGADFSTVASGGKGFEVPSLGVLIAVFSLPIDTCLDLLLLPVDLVAGVCGYHKTRSDQ